MSIKDWDSDSRSEFLKEKSGRQAWMHLLVFLFGLVTGIKNNIGLKLC